MIRSKLPDLSPARRVPPSSANSYVHVPTPTARRPSSRRWRPSSMSTAGLGVSTNCTGRCRSARPRGLRSPRRSPGSASASTCAPAARRRARSVMMLHGVVVDRPRRRSACSRSRCCRSWLLGDEPTMRSTVATTESALNGSPSWNVTPSRSLNSQVVSSTCVGNSVARPGTSSPVGRARQQRLVDVVVDRPARRRRRRVCGSRLVGSDPRAIVIDAPRRRTAGAGRRRAVRGTPRSPSSSLPQPSPRQRNADAGRRSRSVACRLTLIPPDPAVEVCP